MANLPEFTHIHCSSRYDRPAATLESDLDGWMDQASLITLTEITNDRRAATMREKGWAYYNAALGGGRDDCGICWDTSVWKRRSGSIVRISNNTYSRLKGRSGLYLYSCSVVLRNINSGHVLLVTTSHMPAHIQGVGGFKTNVDEWAARKQAMLSGLRKWNADVREKERRAHADATLICADWNLNLKLDWVRGLLHDYWGDRYREAWQRFPTEGGSMKGGPVAPLGAPGVSKGDRIIDGSLYNGLKVTEDPNLMHRAVSSDHRPYKESYRFLSKAEKPLENDHDDKPHGDTKHGDAWWGFGDYMTDELYPTPTATGDAGGEVL